VTVKGEGGGRKTGRGGREREIEKEEESVKKRNA
jgi:hypothetical protein